MKFLADSVAAAKALKAVQKARRHGAKDVRIIPVKMVPIVDFGNWSWTAEACLQYPTGVRSAVKSAFCALDGDTQHKLTFGPGDHSGCLMARAKFWQDTLKDTLPPAQYHSAMVVILEWLIQCRKHSLYGCEAMS